MQTMQLANSQRERWIKTSSRWLSSALREGGTMGDNATTEEERTALSDAMEIQYFELENREEAFFEHHVHPCINHVYPCVLRLGLVDEVLRCSVIIL